MEEDLKNTKELVDDFEGRISTEIRKQEEVDQEQKRRMDQKTEEFKRIELPERYMTKILYGWDDRKFEAECLRKLERNWQKWKSVSPEEKP